MKSDETTIQNVQNYRCNDSVFYCNGLPVCAMHERVNRYVRMISEYIRETPLATHAGARKKHFHTDAQRAAV